MLTTTDLVKESENIKAICLKYGVTKIRIFGSYARSEQNEASDLDILGCKTQSLSLLDLISLEQELTDVLGIRADLYFENGVSKAGFSNVFDEAITL